MNLLTIFLSVSLFNSAPSMDITKYPYKGAPILLNNTPSIDIACPQFSYNGAPIPSKEGKFLCRTGYSLHYNYSTWTPSYVQEYLTIQNFTGTATRTNDFREDTEIPIKYRAKLKDYKELSNIYDRGHMAAAENHVNSTDEMRQTFFLSNMAPQNSGLNRGMWKSIEMRVAKWVKQYGELYVITGPIYDQNMQGGSLKIPDKFFKIVIDPNKNRTITFIVPNRKIEKSDFQLLISTVDEVEKLTGLIFFPNGLKINKNEKLLLKDWLK